MSPEMTWQEPEKNMLIAGDKVQVRDCFGVLLQIHFVRVIADEPLTIEIELIARDEAERSQEIRERVCEWIP